MPLLVGVPKDPRQGKEELTRLTWSRETIIFVLETGELIRCGPDAEKPAEPLPSLRDTFVSLTKGYKTFESCEGLCYYPTDVQASAVINLENALSGGMDQTLLRFIAAGVNGPAGKRLLLGEDGELDIRSVKEFVRGVARPEDARFLERFCETQMLATYIKETYQDKAQ